MYSEINTFEETEVKEALFKLIDSLPADETRITKLNRVFSLLARINFESTPTWFQAILQKMDSNDLQKVSQNQLLTQLQFHNSKITQTLIETHFSSYTRLPEYSVALAGAAPLASPDFDIETLLNYGWIHLANEASLKTVQKLVESKMTSISETEKCRLM